MISCGLVLFSKLQKSIAFPFKVLFPVWCSIILCCPKHVSGASFSHLQMGAWGKTIKENNAKRSTQICAVLSKYLHLQPFTSCGCYGNGSTTPLWGCCETWESWQGDVLSLFKCYYCRLRLKKYWIGELNYCKTFSKSGKFYFSVPGLSG